MLSPWQILEHFTQTLHPHLLFYMSDVDYSVAPPPRSTAEERWLNAGLLYTKGRKPFSSTYLLTKLLRLLPNPLRICIVGKQKLPIWTDASLHIRCQSCVMLHANHPKCCRAFAPWQNRLRGFIIYGVVRYWCNDCAAFPSNAPQRHVTTFPFHVRLSGVECSWSVIALSYAHLSVLEFTASHLSSAPALRHHTHKQICTPRLTIC